MFRVCIADDHELLRLGIRATLEQIEHFELVGEAHTGELVIDLVDALLPDIVLLEIRMPGIDGLTCLRMIKERHPAITVVMLSSSEHPGDISAALGAGASAYLSNRVRPKDLVAALLQVVQGTDPLPASIPVPERVADRDAAAALTVRERALLAALVRGLSTKAISSELVISERTVKFHLTNIYRKLDVHNRASAMRYAYEHSLLAPPREALLQGMAAL